MEFMESPDSAAAAAAAAYSSFSASLPALVTAPDELRRVKFLCSFGGSILPRPLDGKLRYVGGETRIVSVPRDVTYEELMARMRELFEGAWSLKYQQPEEDLDALISVVNDDDVTNMMEEYDKLGAGGDGFTRLRIFLFSHPDHDSGGSSTSAAGAQFDSSDERETERRRYVDALNSSIDGKHQFSVDAVGGVPGTDSRNQVASDQFLSHRGMEAGIHAQFSMHHLNIPHQASVGQRYSDTEGPRSPVYCTPGHHVLHDPREFPPSPSSRPHHPAFGESNDRIPEEYMRQSPSQQPPHHPSLVESVVWLPPGGTVGEMAGFPGNLGHIHNVCEPSSVCEHCLMALRRNHLTAPEARFHDSRWKQWQTHLEHLNAEGDFAGQFSSSTCAECIHIREAYLLNQDNIKLDHHVYAKEHNDHHHFYSDVHGQERGRVLQQHQMNHLLDDPRVHYSERFPVDRNGMNFPVAHGNFYELHSVQPNCIRENPHYVHSAAEPGNEVYHDQHATSVGNHMQAPRVEENGLQYGSNPLYGSDGIFQRPHVSPPIVNFNRKAQGAGPPYEASGSMLQPQHGTGHMRSPQDGSIGFPGVGMDDKVPGSWSVHVSNRLNKVFPISGPVTHEYYDDQAVKPNFHLINKENQHPLGPEGVQFKPGRADYAILSEPGQAEVAPSLSYVGDDVAAYLNRQSNPIFHSDLSRDVVIGSKLPGRSYETSHAKVSMEPDASNIPSKDEEDGNFEPKESLPVVKKGSSLNVKDSNEREEPSIECSNLLPEIISSVKMIKLEDLDETKATVHADEDTSPLNDLSKKELSLHISVPATALEDMGADSDAEQPALSEIEPTVAESEARAKGLQTIKNTDLEEIRELGSGTYGSVYHGKWKGSDVAIKRIKASCFTGKPSERKRLIADFWKEALILSSLHHPNVVSFYGIVRDGPDGSLATVTEFMVNGSLKQVLQKKDRTIDRRKRIIIAMDAAFGMEYLHGKNIVHFDLKCENLLVNMRDHHRPVCKIGDLGLSKVKQKTLVSGGVRGTLPWMAPELLSGKTNMVSDKVDVYSFGISMWELLTGEEPYADMHCASIIGGIVNNTLRPTIPTWCDPEWKSLMETCWSSDPADRPSFSDISQRLRKMAAAVNVK